MSEWAEREQQEAQKHLNKNEEAEALDPSGQAAAAQSAELAEDVAPEEEEQAHPERPLREKAQTSHFDLLDDDSEELELAAGATADSKATAPNERSTGEKSNESQPLTEIRPPEVEASASRAGRGGAAAELRGDEGMAGVRDGRGVGREIDMLLASVREAFEPSARPLAFTARKRRRINDLADPELDALLAAVRETYPAAPEVVAEPAVAGWAEEGGVAYDEPPPRGVLTP